MNCNFLETTNNSYLFSDRLGDGWRDQSRHAVSSNQPWHKHSESSRIAASEGKWKRACRQAILAGAMKDKAGNLSSEYIAKIGNRYTKAGL